MLLLDHLHEELRILSIFFGMSLDQQPLLQVRSFEDYAAACLKASSD